MNWLSETHGIYFELVRHFLARMFDSEMFSSRGQWRAVAISGFALAVPAGMFLLDPPYLRRFRPPPIADELAVLTLLFGITGVLALLSWQSLFPTRRDFLALASFPARPRQIFAARFISVLVFAVSMVGTICFLPSVVPPHFFTAHRHTDVLANGAPAVLGCLSIFFAIVALQGVLLNLLPGRLFTQASTVMQGLLVAVFFLAGLYSWFIVEWKQDTIDRLPDLGWWAPPVWFGGLHQVLSGVHDPFSSAMARRGLMAFAIALSLAIFTYVLSYRRFRKLLLESTDSARPMLTWNLLRLIAANPRQEAIIQFLGTVLARSRTHRLVLMAYAGAALGIMINTALLTGVRHGSVGVAQFAVLYWPLGTSFLMLSGIRHVFSMPVDVTSNWLFQITESQGRREWMSATERFVAVTIIIPIYLISTPIAALVLDWPVALRMAVLQILVSLTTFDLLFNEWQQLPFTCTYVPGKKPLMSLVANWIAVLCVVTPFLTMVISTVARIPELFLVYGVFFVGDWIWARKRRMEGWGESKLIYQDLFEIVASLGIKDMTYRTATVEVSGPVRAPDPPDIPDSSSGLWLRLKAAVHRQQFDQDLEDELQFHLSMSERAESRPSFGNVASIKEECRDQWTFVWLETLWQDLRYGALQLRRAPAFTIVTALTLAFGIGATTAIYSMCDAVLWRPVALPRVESLVMILQSVPGNPHLWSPAAPVDIADIGHASANLEGVASWSYGMANIVATGGEPARVEQVRVTANFFSVLEVEPAIGHGFQGGEREVILSDGCWRRRFGADPNILRKQIWLDNSLYAVVGVMPPTFAFPRVSKELWTPLRLTPEEQRSRESLMVDSIARLRPGHSIKDVSSELDVLASRLEKMYPGSNRNRRFQAWQVQRFWTGDYAAEYSQLLLGAAFFVLLICCANVANLQFARGAGRLREIAIRAAVGAGRARLLRQLITESLLLAVLGAIAGVQVSGWALQVIKAGVPAAMRQYMPGWADIGLNPRALLFALGATLISGILAGLAPALQSSRGDLTECLKEGGGAASAGRSRRGIRNVLVAGEIALATVLVIGAGMMVQSFRANLDSGAAMDPDSLLTLSLAPTDARYREVLERIVAIPGVRSAAVVSALPHSRHSNVRPFAIEGSPDSGGERRAQYQAASASYFETLQIPLRAGRLLSNHDGAGQPPTAVIAQSLAEKWWPDERAAIGRRIQIQHSWMTIVGVVGDIETQVPTVYVSYLQAAEQEMDVAIRTSLPPMQLAPRVRSAIGPGQTITNLYTMRELIRQENFGLVYIAALMGTFGVLALALSFIGVYGLLSYVVAERTREVGVRMALGATPRAMVSMFCRDGLRVASAGFATGFVLALVLARVMRATIFGMTAESLALWCLPLLLAAAVAMAIYLPARRAMRIDPMLALREE